MSTCEAETSEQPEDVKKTEDNTETTITNEVNSAPVVSNDESTEKHFTTSGHGVASLKAQYLVVDYKPEVDSRYLSDDVKKSLLDTENFSKNEEQVEEPPSKRIRLKGRNKRRPVNERTHDSKKMCPCVLHDRECVFDTKCKFSHDVVTFLAEKPEDIGHHCHNFETFGKCPFGAACRFGSKHISADGKNIINTELFEKTEKDISVRNVMEKNLQKTLWKKKYDFSKADRAVKQVEQGIGDRGAQSNSNWNSSSSVQKVENCTDNLAPEASADVGSDIQGQTSKSSQGESTKVRTPSFASHNIDEEGIRLRPAEKKKVDFANKLYLAPLTTAGNLPYRRICKQYGADITCGEMAVAINLIKGQQSEWSLLKRHKSEDVFGIQLCGGNPDIMAKCAQLINDKLDVDFVDINCGCPIELIFEKGQGCALMGKATKLEKVVRSMTSVMDVPLTLKMRTGIYSSKSVAHTLIPKLRDSGISMVTLHGRSREQRYTRLADWDYINLCADLGKPMPVYGNGDILSFEDYNLHMEQNSVSGIMLARGALMKPWLFTEIKEQRHWDISANERFDMLGEYVNFGLEHWGSDQQGVQNTRRFLLEWLSFLYRYIPVGLLERLPQKINERPPKYVGRSDLETLMSSANCGDWIKLSEMLLGPVPDGFTFLPKHKANAYK